MLDQVPARDGSQGVVQTTPTHYIQSDRADLLAGHIGLAPQRYRLVSPALWQDMPEGVAASQIDWLFDLQLGPGFLDGDPGDYLAAPEPGFGLVLIPAEILATAYEPVP